MIVPSDAKQAHEVAYQDLVTLVAKHADEMSELDILAVAANLVGKLVAMQDQRVTTSKEAMEVVSRNIERGNQDAIRQLMASEGTA